MKINTGSLLTDIVEESIDTHEAHKLFKTGEISYSDYSNQIKHSIPSIVKSTLKNTAGATGLVMASHMAMNYYQTLTSGNNIGIGQFLSSDSTSTAIMGLCTTIYIMYSLADKYKETLSYDAKNRVFHLEDLTKNIEINNINGVINRQLTTPADYVYFRMMNKISTIDGFVDKGMGGITNGLKYLKEGFLSMKNFVKNISNKAFKEILEVKLIRKIIGENYSENLKANLQEYLKLDYIDDFNKKFMNSISKVEQNKDLHEKISRIALNDFNNTKPSTLKKVLAIKNEQALTDTYHIDMNQRLVLKFSKTVTEFITNKKTNIENMEKFGQLAQMSTFKTNLGIIENDVHVEISKMANNILNEPDKFLAENKNKKFLDIVKKIDNLMVKDNKVVFRGFKEIFFAVRNEKLDNTLYSNKNKLQEIIQSKIRGVKITENDIEIDHNIESNKKIWDKARQKINKHKI